MSPNMGEVQSPTGQTVGEGGLLSDPPPTDRHTDRFRSYVSIRLTVSETDINSLIKTAFDDVPFIIYRHEGKDKTNPHYHVLLCPDHVDDKLCDKIRNRIKRAGFSGNKYVSIKLNHNGLLQGIQYCSHENTQPAVSDPSLFDIIAHAPKWVQRTIDSYQEPSTKRPKGDPDWQLTYTNLVSVAVRHARECCLTDSSLKSTVGHLIKHTKWRPSKWLITGGVPEFYENDYLMRLGKRKEPDMNWWTPKSI